MLPLQLVLKVSDLLKKHRAELGTRNGTRALTCWQQAKFILAWFRDKPDLRRLGEGFGISQSTAYRYKDEGVEVLAREAPSLEEALERAAGQGIPYVILDGTLIPSDRCSDKKTSRKGTEIDKWYSGKSHEHAGLVQGIISPDGVPLWASEVRARQHPRHHRRPRAGPARPAALADGISLPRRFRVRGSRLRSARPGEKAPQRRPRY